MPKSDNRLIKPIVLVSEHLLRRFPALVGRLTLGLTEKSIPTTLVCAPGIDLVPLLRGPVEVIRYPSCDLPLAERMEQGRLLAQLASANPTVLHCLCETKASQARKWSRLLDIPYVLNINAPQDDAGTLSLSSTRCVRIICPTRTIAENVGVTYPRLADRIVQIAPGVFVEDQCCCFRDPQQQTSLVMAHPFEQAEVFAPVFKAMCGLLSLGYEFNAVLMGHGPAERSIRGMLMEMDLMQVVTIVPELNPWRSVLAAGDIFIQPQAMRGLDFFLLEAMGVGAAVAACRGGADDMVVDGQTALVFDPGDHQSVQTVLQRLLDQPEMARGLARAGQAYLRAKHSTSEMIQGILQTYHTALKWSYGLANLS